MLTTQTSSAEQQKAADVAYGMQRQEIIIQEFCRKFDGISYRPTPDVYSPLDFLIVRGDDGVTPLAFAEIKTLSKEWWRFPEYMQFKDKYDWAVFYKTHFGIPTHLIVEVKEEQTYVCFDLAAVPRKFSTWCRRDRKGIDTPKDTVMIPKRLFSALPEVPGGYPYHMSRP